MGQSQKRDTILTVNHEAGIRSGFAEAVGGLAGVRALVLGCDLLDLQPRRTVLERPFKVRTLAD